MSTDNQQTPEKAWEDAAEILHKRASDVINPMIDAFITNMKEMFGALPGEFAEMLREIESRKEKRSKNEVKN